MENVHQDTSPSPQRSERLEAIRKNLDACIDEIVTARPERAAALKKEFDAVWKELDAEMGATRH